MTLPSTVAELNDWIRTNFQAFEGPHRAYFELPVNLSLADIGQVTMHKRVTYLTLGLIGPEKDVVQHVASCLQDAVTQDQNEPIFIRRWFVYEEHAETQPFNKVSEAIGCTAFVHPMMQPPKRYKLYGRLSFWRPVLNNLLMASTAFMPEGQGAKSI